MTKLPTPKENIFTTNENPVFSANIEYPDCSMGFHHFYHQSKNKMSLTSNFIGKKKVYNVMNKYERVIDEYPDSIEETAAKYFGTKKKISSQDFYKMWELLFLFDLVDLKDDKFMSIHINDKVGSFAAATELYREKFSKKSKTDKYYNVTTDSKYNKTGKKEDMLPKTKASLITANGKFDYKIRNMREQHGYLMLLQEISMALDSQEKGGSFVCKFEEIFTNVSAKLLCMLSACYTNIYIVKPLTSRLSNSERFVVCTGFKSANVDKIDTIINKAKNNLNLLHIFPSYNIPDDLRTVLTKSNVIVANQQFITINKMISFINKQNYRGDDYVTNRAAQIEAARQWIESFLPTESEFAEKKKKVIIA